MCFKNEMQKDFRALVEQHMLCINHTLHKLKGDRNRLFAPMPILQVISCSPWVGMDAHLCAGIVNEFEQMLGIILCC